jgi:hypothetical protein
LSPDKWGPEAVLQTLLLIEISRRAQEFFEQGGRIHLDDRVWAQLADRAEIAGHDLPKVQEGWQRPRGWHPAFLSRVDGLWGLADPHAPARALLLDTGRRTHRARQRAARRPGKLRH